MQIRVPSGTVQSIRISGVVHDPGLAPAWQERAGYGYVSLDTFRALGGVRGFDEIRILLKDKNASVAEIQNQANKTAEFLAARGFVIREIRVPPPGRHPHQGQMNAVLILFVVFGFLTLIFAAILVATSISTLMTRQVREIGVMKTLGAGSREVAALYLLLIFLISSLAVVIAIPMSRLAASLLIGNIASMLNIRIYDGSTPSNVALVQLLSGILIPLLAALVPVVRGSRITVREALINYGVSQSSFGYGRFESLLSKLRLFGTDFTLAMRNVFRHRARLIMTLGLLAAGGAMFLSSLNLSRAWDANVNQIYSQRLYDLEFQFSAPLKSPVAAVTRVRKVPGVLTAETWQSALTSFSNSGKFDATRAYPDGGHGRSVIFALPTNSRVVNFPLIEGRWLQSKTGKEAVLNAAARSQLPNLRIGDNVWISVKRTNSQWKVVGFVRDLGTPGPAAYVPLTAFERTAPSAGCCNLIRVALKDRNPKTASIKTREIEEALEQQGETVAFTLPMSELRKALSEHTTVLIRSLLALAALMGAVGGIGLTSTMSMNILERTRELGVMRAIGATPKTVARLVVLEGLVIGTASLFFAFLFSLPLSGYLGMFVGNMAFRSPLPLTISYAGLVEWVALVIGGSVIATLYPAVRAGELTTGEALAYE